MQARHGVAEPVPGVGYCQHCHNEFASMSGGFGGDEEQ